MTWLVLCALWLAVACVVAVVVGLALRVADRNDRARCQVEAWTSRELAGS